MDLDNNFEERLVSLRKRLKEAKDKMEQVKKQREIEKNKEIESNKKRTRTLLEKTEEFALVWKWKSDLLDIRRSDKIAMSRFAESVNQELDEVLVTGSWKLWRATELNNFNHSAATLNYIRRQKN